MTLILQGSLGIISGLALPMALLIIGASMSLNRIRPFALPTLSTAAIKRIDLSVKRFAWMVLSADLLVSGVNLYIADHIQLGVTFTAFSMVVFLWGLRKV